VVHLTDALSRQSEDKVILLSQGLAGSPSVPSVEARVQRYNCETSSSYALALGLGIRRELAGIVHDSPPSLIHSHGLWLPVNHWAARIARRNSIPLIIQPRGMLATWALNDKAKKKKLAMTLFQRRDLETASVLIATAAMEYESIRSLGLRQPVAVIPNGVLFNSSHGLDGEADALRSSKVERTVLFLSRVHPKKGILNLLRAWSVVEPQGWRLMIAGPDEGGHLADVMALTHDLGIEQVVDYIGEVEGQIKAQTYLDADLFVLPTFSENFGVVVAEALAHGLPVITTRGTPWADLETYGCGWWIDIGVDPLVHALRDAIALSDDKRRLMGIRGRAYVRRYDWDDIARQMMNVYRWVLTQGPQPDCVQVD
jgi:glycosyltransferase involved in cell wall biosynthesis